MQFCCCAISITEIAVDIHSALNKAIDSEHTITKSSRFKKKRVDQLPVARNIIYVDSGWRRQQNRKC